MGHPANRAERRHQRDRVVARRRFSLDYVPNNAWRIQYRTNPLLRGPRFRVPVWGKYSKWNLSCGSLMCHAGKHFSARRKRREALKHAGEDDLRDSFQSLCASDEASIHANDECSNAHSACARGNNSIISGDIFPRHA